jgi:hypothetical protein
MAKFEFNPITGQLDLVSVVDPDPGEIDNALQLENGDFLLLENGDYLLTEQA